MSWPPKDWRAFIALVGSIGGAAMLTVFVWWGCAMLLPSEQWSRETEHARLDTIRWVLWIASGAIAIVLIGLGMAINRRSFRANWGKAGLGYDGGDGDPLPEVAFGREQEP